MFACDISDKARLVDILKKCKASLPPMRGCIQGSMVLADKIFENMSHEKFRAATRPKVQGSWNLHACLPRDMDFFILLSSATGLVGNRGQANYAAGNTYQDALAAHRVSLGLPATSFDLGTLLSIGYVAENRQRLGHITHVASLLGSIREEDIHRMIEYCLEPTGQSKRPIQIASALTTAAQYQARCMPAPSWMHMPLFNQEFRCHDRSRKGGQRLRPGYRFPIGIGDILRRCGRHSGGCDAHEALEAAQHLGREH